MQRSSRSSLSPLQPHVPPAYIGAVVLDQYTVSNGISGRVVFFLYAHLQDYFEEGLTDAEVVGSLCSPEFAVSLTGVDPKQEQVCVFMVYDTPRAQPLVHPLHGSTIIYRLRVGGEYRRLLCVDTI